MAEEIKEEVLEEELHEEEPKKKGLLGKVKSAILPDAEEQAAIISTFVRITVLAWSCLLYTSPSPRDKRQSRMPSSA